MRRRKKEDTEVLFSFNAFSFSLAKFCVFLSVIETIGGDTRWKRFETGETCTEGSVNVLFNVKSARLFCSIWDFKMGWARKLFHLCLTFIYELQFLKKDVGIKGKKAFVERVRLLM